MSDFDKELAELSRVRRCGTRTDWHEPPTYVIPPREPVNFDLVRQLWPELETVA